MWGKNRMRNAIKALPEARACSKCEKPLRASSVGDVCFRCRTRGSGKAPADPLATMLGPLLRKAEKMLTKAEKLEWRISELHRQATSLRDAAEKIKALCPSSTE